MEEMSLGHLLEEIVDPERNFGVEVTVLRQGDGFEPICRRNPGMLYGLGNLVENAIDFARTSVAVEARWTRDSVRIVIRDDGPGFASDIIARVGEPYVTTKGPGRRSKSEAGSGLGLGLFIAKTLLERSGAAVTTSNAPPPACGAIVMVSWPRTAFERDKTRRAATVNRKSPVLFMRA